MNLSTRHTSAQDYYPFGSLEPGRTYSSESYRFGFNGKENDNEVKGTGNQQDYGMRIYDPRLGKFLSADPLIVQQQKYPELSPYQFASNTPIMAIDLDGLEASANYAFEGKDMYYPEVYLQIDLQIISAVSNKRADFVNYLKESVPAQMEATLGGTFKYRGVLFIMDATVTVSPYKDAYNDQYVLLFTSKTKYDPIIHEFEDDIDPYASGYTHDLGKGCTQQNCFDIYLNYLNSDKDFVTQDATHEIAGHGLNLRHIKFGLKKSVAQNLMQPVRGDQPDQLQLTDRQRFKAVKSVLKDTGQWKKFKKDVKEYKKTIKGQ